MFAKKILLLLALSAGSFCVSAQVDQNNVTVNNEHTGAQETIDLPEGMIFSADSLLNKWMAKKYLFPDTTCVDPDVNPTFTPDEYKERLRRLPVVIDMPYNGVVQKFIDQYSGRLRRSVSFMLGAGNYYVPIFEEALDYYGLPLELKYLPVIESALDPTAVSHAGAVGLWQFMPATAKRYDLTVNSLIDERRDPYKSTYAAARYLRDLYKMFGDWNLVIAAYNCGPTNVSKAIRRAGGQNDYWVIYPYLPQETRGYVPAFIAANYIMNYYCEHNICPMKSRLPISTDTVMVSRDLHLTAVAELCGVDREVLKSLNPQYRTDVVPGHTAPMALSLPYDMVGAFIDLGDSVYNHRASELLTRRSTVAVNDGGATEVQSGKKKSSTTSRTTAASRRKKSRATRAKTVTIRQGDTLGEIAQRHGTTVAKLRRLNGIKGNNIRAGKKLRVR